MARLAVVDGVARVGGVAEGQAQVAHGAWRAQLADAAVAALAPGIFELVDEGPIDWRPSLSTTRAAWGSGG